jgi:hypothetical protein
VVIQFKWSAIKTLILRNATVFVLSLYLAAIHALKCVLIVRHLGNMVVAHRNALGH